MTRHARAVRLVVVLLFTNLALSVVFFGLTLAARHNVLDYQVAHALATGDARGPAEIRRALELTLWTRPIPVLVVAVGYLWVARRMGQGDRRAYQRARWVSIVGVVAVGYLIVSGAYPGWLRVVQVLQLALLIALVVATNRRVVREGFAPTPKPPRRHGSRRAALTLVVLAPVVAELSLGTVPLAMIYLVVLYVPIYGFGVLLVRELVRRTGGGWASVLLLGLAYGLVEEGLALQSLTSPHLYGAADWAPRLLGVNTAYTELNLPYHAVFSVLIPIALVELLFPGLGRAPYLGRRGLIRTGVVALLGAGLIRVSVPPAEDPGYVLPTVALVTIAVLIATLVTVGLRLPARRSRAGEVDAPGPTVSGRGGAPRSVVVGLCCGFATLGFFGLLYPFGGAERPAFTHGGWVLAPMAGAAVLAVVIGSALLRWSRAGNWGPRHRLAAIGGALLAHTAFGAVAVSDHTADVLALVVIGVVTAVLLALFSRRLPAVATVGDRSVPAASVELGSLS